MKDHMKLIAVRAARKSLEAGMGLDEAHGIAQETVGRRIERDLLRSALEVDGWEDGPSDFFGESLRVGDGGGLDLDAIELPAG